MNTEIKINENWNSVKWFSKGMAVKTFILYEIYLIFIFYCLDLNWLRNNQSIKKKNH